MKKQLGTYTQIFYALKEAQLDQLMNAFQDF